MSKIKSSVTFPQLERRANSNRKFLTSFVGTRSAYDVLRAQDMYASLSPEMLSAAAAMFLFKSSPELRRRLVIPVTARDRIAVLDNLGDRVSALIASEHGGLLGLTQSDGKLTSDGYILHNPGALALLLAGGSTDNTPATGAFCYSAVLTLLARRAELDYPALLSADLPDDLREHLAGLRNQPENFSKNECDLLSAQLLWRSLVYCISVGDVASAFSHVRYLVRNDRDVLGALKYLKDRYGAESDLASSSALKEPICARSQQVYEQVRQLGYIDAALPNIFAADEFNMPEPEQAAEVLAGAVVSLLVAGKEFLENKASSSESLVDKSSGVAFDTFCDEIFGYMTAMTTYQSVSKRMFFSYMETSNYVHVLLNGSDHTAADILSFLNKITAKTADANASAVSVMAKTVRQQILNSIYSEGVKLLSKDAMNMLLHLVFDRLLIQHALTTFLQDFARNVKSQYDQSDSLLSMIMQKALELKSAVTDVEIKNVRDTLVHEFATSYPLANALVALSDTGGRGSNKLLAYLSDKLLAGCADKAALLALQNFYKDLSSGSLLVSRDTNLKRASINSVITGVVPLRVDVTAFCSTAKLVKHPMWSDNKPGASLLNIIATESQKIMYEQASSSEVFDVNVSSIFSQMISGLLLDETARANIRSGGAAAVTSVYDWSKNVKDALGSQAGQYFSAGAVQCATACRARYVAVFQLLAYAKHIVSTMLTLPDELLQNEFSSNEDGTPVTYAQRLGLLVEAIDSAAASLVACDADRERYTTLGSAIGLSDEVGVALKVVAKGDAGDGFTSVLPALNSICSSEVLACYRQLAVNLAALEKSREGVDAASSTKLSDLPLSAFGLAGTLALGAQPVSLNNPERSTNISDDTVSAWLRLCRTHYDKDFKVQFRLALDFSRLLGARRASTLAARCRLRNVGLIGLSDIADYDALAPIIEQDVATMALSRFMKIVSTDSLTTIRYANAVRELGPEPFAIARISTPLDDFDEIVSQCEKVSLGGISSAEVLERMLNAVGLSTKTQVSKRAASHILRVVEANCTAARRFADESHVSSHYPLAIKQGAADIEAASVYIGDLITISPEWEAYTNTMGYASRITFILPESYIERSFSRLHVFESTIQRRPLMVDVYSGDVFNDDKAPAVIVDIEDGFDVRYADSATARYLYAELLDQLSTTVAEMISDPSTSLDSVDNVLY